MGKTERRKSPRVILDLVSVEVYARPGADPEPEVREICSVKNISETGMLFESNAAFDRDTTLRLTFALLDSPIAIRTDAIVIHSATRKRHETGVRYKNMAAAERKLLRFFIAKSLTESLPRDDDPACGP